MAWSVHITSVADISQIMTSTWNVIFTLFMATDIIL